MFELKKQVCKECQKDKALILFSYKTAKKKHDIVCMDCRNEGRKKSEKKSRYF